jgi:hypothetical protein
MVLINVHHFLRLNQVPDFREERANKAARLGTPGTRLGHFCHLGNRITCE